MEYLGLDMWMEILSRLCVKDLIRLKSVSKTFLDLISSLISNDDFIRLHLNKSRFRAICSNRYIHLCLKQQHGEEVQSSLRIIPMKNQIRTYFDYRKQYGREVDGMGTLCHAEFLGSCNGLVCLSPQFEKHKYRDGVLLWNPALRETEFIPIKRPEQTIYATWFGYDNGEYKLILGTRYHMHLIRLYIDTDTWKSSHNINRNYVQCVDLRGTLAHRTVHWSAQDKDKDYKPFILTYDIRNETVGRIATPHTRCCPFTLGEVDGCLSTVIPKRTNMELWVMKEHGNEESWTKLMNLPLNCFYTYITRPTPHYVVELDDPAQLSPPIYGKNFYVESLISPRSIKIKMC